eukprot:gene11814-48084_t
MRAAALAACALAAPAAAGSVAALPARHPPVLSHVATDFAQHFSCPYSKLWLEHGQSPHPRHPRRTEGGFTTVGGGLDGAEKATALLGAELRVGAGSV